MNIPNQLQIRDIVNYFVVGALYLFSVAGFYWNFTGENLFSYLEIKWLQIISFVIISYL